MPFNAEVGEVFWLRDSSGRRHRYLILTKPNDDGRVVLVNFTEQRGNRDQTRVFGPHHEAQLFDKPTIVNYPFAKLVSQEHLLEQVEENSDLCPEDIFAEVLSGAIQSPHTEEGIKQEIGAQYPDEFAEYYTPPNI